MRTVFGNESPASPITKPLHRAIKSSQLRSCLRHEGTSLEGICPDHSDPLTASMPTIRQTAAAKTHRASPPHEGRPPLGISGGRELQTRVLCLACALIGLQARSV